MASVHTERVKRPDEHASAARIRCGGQPSDSREQYQRVSGLKSLFNSLVTVLTPVLATMVFSFAGIDAVLAFDLITFSAAFITLAWFITIHRRRRTETGKNLYWLLQRRPQIPEKEPRYSESYPVSGGHQLNRVHVQRRTARHDSFQKRGSRIALSVW